MVLDCSLLHLLELLLVRHNYLSGVDVQGIFLDLLLGHMIMRRLLFSYSCLLFSYGFMR